MSTTHFETPACIVFSTSRAVDALRSATRNERIDEAYIANRSNYTRVTFTNSTSAAFLIPVGPYSLRIRSTPNAGACAMMVGIGGEKVGMALSAAEMRAMAYGLLAAANWIDSRDTERNQKERRPRTI
jgi:hypothetical protein